MHVLLATPSLGAKSRVPDVLCHTGAFGGLRVVDCLALVPRQQVVGTKIGFHSVVLHYAIALRCLKRQVLQRVVLLFQHDDVAARLTFVRPIVVVVAPQIHRGELRHITWSHHLEEFRILFGGSGDLIDFRCRIVFSCSFCTRLSYGGIHTGIVDGGIVNVLALAVDNIDLRVAGA